MIINYKKTIEGRLLYVIRSFVQVGFRFQYQLINLVWLSIVFFSFSWSKSRPQSNFRKLKNSFSSSCYSVKMRWGQSWAETSLSTFLWHYILVCAVVQKYHEMFFLKKFFLVLILQSTCSIFTTSKRKQTMEHQPHRVYEWTKSNKKSYVTFKLNTRSTVRFSPQTMQLYH